MLDLQRIKMLALQLAVGIAVLWAIGAVIGKIGLLAILAGISFIGWKAFTRVTMHMRQHPEAARLLAENVIVPLLTGSDAKQKDDVLPHTQEQQKGKGLLE